MKKITTIALATMIVSSLSVMPALAADIFSDDSGSALAAGKNAVVSASDISDSGNGSAMMVNWEDGSTAWVSFEAAPEKAELAETENIIISVTEASGSSAGSVMMVDGEDGSVRQIPNEDTAE